MRSRSGLGPALETRIGRIPVPVSSRSSMNLTRPIVFWIAMLAAVIAVIVLLREVLLPFVASLVLAYLLIRLRAESNAWE